MTQNGILSQNLIKCIVCTHGKLDARTAPCRRPGPAVSQEPPAMSVRPRARCVAGRVLRTVSFTVSSRRASCRAPPASYRGDPCAVSWRLPRPCRACLAIQPSSWPRARTLLHALCAQAGRVMVSPCRVMASLGRVVACLSGIVAAPACTARPYPGMVPLLCHDTMHCIITQPGKMGSSPFQLLHCFFFFFTQIFFFIPATGKPPKNK